MKKSIIFLVLAFLSIATASFAVTRYTVTPQENESYFGNVGATGAPNTGNPGYIIIYGTGGPGSGDTVIPWYIWPDSDGKLRMASYSNISAYTSFPSGDWRTNLFKAGGTVGSQ